MLKVQQKNNMAAVERLYRKPIRETIFDLYLELHNKKLVAEALGISAPTLNGWCQALGITPVDLRLARLKADQVSKGIRAPSNKNEAEPELTR